MRSEDIMTAMNFIDDNLLTDNDGQTKKTEKFRIAKPAVVAAAVFVLFAVSIIGLSTYHKPEPIELSVPLTEYAMGFEGEALDNTDEYEYGYPEFQHFLTMPVYTDNTHDKKGTPAALTENQLEQRLAKASALTGIAVDNKVKSRANDLYGGYENDFVYAITSESEGGTIIVNAAGGVTAIFSRPHKLDYDFDPTAKENREKAMEHFSDIFADFISEFISYESPAFITSREMLVDCTYIYTYRAFDSSGNGKDDILKSNVQYAEFMIDSGGMLNSIHISDSTIDSVKIGNYPVKSEKTAKKELLEGKYFSTVPYGIKDGDCVIKSELIYKSIDGLFIPCYKFLVELPDAPPDDRYKSYGIFYVCAIKDEYIR